MKKRSRSKGPVELLEDDDLVEYFINEQIKKGKFEYVLEIVDQAMAYTRRPASILVWKALAHASLDQLGEAENAARAALQHQPGSESAVITLASLLLHSGRGDDAIELCDEFIARYPNSEEVARHKIDITTFVAKSCRQHIRRFGPTADVLAQLANAYMELGEYDKAERAYRHAVKLEPGIPEHHFGIILLAYLRDDPDGAEKYLQDLGTRNEFLAKRLEAEVDRFLEKFRA